MQGTNLKIFLNYFGGFQDMERCFQFEEAANTTFYINTFSPHLLYPCFLVPNPFPLSLKSGDNFMRFVLILTFTFIEKVKGIAAE